MSITACCCNLIILQLCPMTKFILLFVTNMALSFFVFVWNATENTYIVIYSILLCDCHQLIPLSEQCCVICTYVGYQEADVTS